jgi:hypothetical protein
MSWEHDELATVIGEQFEHPSDPDCQMCVDVNRAAEAVIKSGYRKIFDGNCGLSNITDESDREAAEAWMRWANLLNCSPEEEPNGIWAMKQMLTEFGYKRATQ